ncbi:QcrA and Rieske domain-containing protein [Halococcoides cellulosivorans]|uniref:Rieske iron-sulfur protein n=1 Tax=Halococcoides cellulosivorans TaxID=1679096 RepID=A0A2R4X0Z3_9EURY|nr:Rieske (2Fe-2S) protein [Halococcoides cellulosivorans]AWB27462.1 Rieske iron-sulfur protein [Halococcoides cellulosivorans]
MSDPESETDTVASTAEGEQSREELLRTTRRNAATLFAGIAGTAAIGSFAVTGLVGLDRAALEGGPDRLYAEGVRLVDEAGETLGVDAIPEGSGETMTVFPEAEGGGPIRTQEATTVLVRFTDGDYEDPTTVSGTVAGYAAYSRVCTHAGCIVSQRSGPDGQYFLCPCHQSEFDPLEGASVAGGPATKPLPQLPIGLTEDDELIVATGEFDDTIGPG